MKRKITFFVMLSLFGLSLQLSGQGTWITKASMPTARQHLCSAVYDDKIYVLGGHETAGNQMLATNELYDPSTDTWVVKNPMPSAVGFCNVGTVNGKLYVIGGWNGSYQTNQNWEYDPVNNSWVVKANMPTIRSDAAVAVVDNKIYAIGGWQYGSNPRNENEMYDPATNTWVSKAPMPTPRGYLTVAVVNNKIYAIGGGNSIYVRPVEVYDPLTNTWTTKSSMPSDRGGLASVVINDEIYVFGGSTNPNDTTLIYTPATDSWRTAPLLPTHRVFLTASQVSNKAYVIGGSVTGNSPVFLVNEMFSPDLTPPAIISIIASANPECQGETVTYTASVQPPAPNAFFQWYVNGNMVFPPSGGSSTYSYVPQSGDTVYCVVTIPGSPPVISTSNSIIMTVHPLPAPTITGSNSLCVNSGYFTYTTEAGMLNYQWNISSGGTITYGSGTNQLQVTWNIPGNQWVSVNYSNPNGCTSLSPVIFNVIVNPLPGPAGSITGTSTVCAGAQGVSYFTTPVANTIYYVWILPSGASIVSGSGTNSIIVDFSDSAISGDIMVYGNNLCGNGTISPPFPVTVNPLPAAPGTVSGPSNICKPATGVIFSVETVNGATGYTWTLPPSSILVAGGNTNSVTVDFPIESYSGIVSVVATSSCGDSPPSPSLVVNVTAIPAAPLILERNDTLFSNLGNGNQWYRNDSLIPGAVMYYYLPDQSGEYWDIVSTENCFSDTSNHIVVVMSGVVSLQSAVCSLYPVPNNGMFVISMTSPEKEIFDIIIYNDLGQNIFEVRDIEVTGTFKKQIDLRPVPPGIYSVVFRNQNIKVVRKIVVTI
jgi:N-acetylneuraminic acid mutarotase